MGWTILFLLQASHIIAVSYGSHGSRNGSTGDTVTQCEINEHKRFLKHNVVETGVNSRLVGTKDNVDIVHKKKIYIVY